MEDLTFSLHKKLPYSLCMFCLLFISRLILFQLRIWLRKETCVIHIFKINSVTRYIPMTIHCSISESSTCSSKQANIKKPLKICTKTGNCIDCYHMTKTRFIFCMYRFKQMNQDACSDSISRIKLKYQQYDSVVLAIWKFRIMKIKQTGTSFL